MKILLVVITSFAFLNLNAQIKNIPVALLDSLISKERIYYLQDDGKTYYGCGQSLEAKPINILFKEAKIDPSKKIVQLSFNIYEAFMIRQNGLDTIGLVANIFLAKPDKDKLINKQLVNFSKVNIETGYYEIDFIYKKGMNLYFDCSGIYCTVEMFLNKLFE